MSAWESDTRPSQSCVVCRGVPDRVVELPDLDDVHVAFASSAMCTTCANLAADNAADDLTRRAAARWVDEDDEDDEVVTAVVRTAVAAFGHPPPHNARRHEPHRHRAAEPLSAADAAVWSRLEPLIHDGPHGASIPVRGVIEYEADGERDMTEAHRDGPRARLADADGVPWLICDGERVWRREDGGAMVMSSYDDVDGWAGGGSELAARRTRDDVDVFGFSTPLGPIEPTICLGRQAWRFRFAAPAHKPFDMAVVIDDETGMMLEQRFGDYSLARWKSFETGVRLADELFVWEGAVVDVETVRATRWTEHEEYEQRQSEWFAANVTAAPLWARGRSVEVMLHLGDDDGSMEASLSGGIEGALARRRRSDDWWRLEWSDVTHRWSDATWDWALSDFDDLTPPLGDRDLAALKRALGST